MPRGCALEQALDLLAKPSLVRVMQAGTLPDEVSPLLQILTRDPEAEASAIERFGRSKETLREASEFYAAHILFAPQGGHYRVLAAEPHATREQLRANMGLLLRWLHPDIRKDHEYGGFFDRVTRAWDVLGSAQKRADYDLTLKRVPATVPPPRPPMVRPPGGRPPFFRSVSDERYAGMKRARRIRRRRIWRIVWRVALVSFLAAASWVFWTHPLWLDQLLEMDWLFDDALIVTPASLKAACLDIISRSVT